jgi:hypothetical protein
MKTTLNIAVLVIALSILNGTALKSSFADDKNTIIKGVVVDESGKKVSSGVVKIFYSDRKSCEVKYFENVFIQADGSFESKCPFISNSTDDIHIAAYPYDLDLNTQEPIYEDIIQIAAYPYDLDIIIIQNPISEDNVTIAAYPYDLDNSGIISEPLTLELKEQIFEADKNEIELVIKIKRTNFEEIKIKDTEAGKNFQIKLNQNFPNPFNPSTLISFDLEKASNVTLQVYSMSGKLISTLINNKYFAAGNRHVQFNANDLPSGIYVYKLIAGDQTLTKKMTLLK